MWLSVLGWVERHSGGHGVCSATWLLGSSALHIRQIDDGRVQLAYLCEYVSRFDRSPLYEDDVGGGGRSLTV